MWTRVDLRGLTPISLTLTRGKLAVGWCNLHPYALREPFFDQTVRRAVTAGKRKIITTGLDALLDHDWPQRQAALAAIIFHLPRSGSTLATRLLDCVDGVFCLREPSIINQLLCLPTGAMDKSLRIKTLQILGLGLASIRRGNDEYAILKTSSWNVCAADLFKQAFPEVPKVWIQRQPEAVMQSLLNGPPTWLSSIGFFRQVCAATGLRCLSQRRLQHRALFSVSAMLQAAGRMRLAVLEFDQLRQATAELAESILATPLDTRTRAALQKASVLDAKSPTPTRFKPHIAIKQSVRRPARCRPRRQPRRCAGPSRLEPH